MTSRPATSSKLHDSTPAATSTGSPDTIAAVELPGRWRHLRLAAHGARFHVALSERPGSTGRLVLFLHGFPEFWWAWRHQLPALADAGYRAAAMDLRGYGGSDKTPRGYDPVNLADDVAGVIAALGADSAVVVGHGWGGMLGWSFAAIHPLLTDGLVAVSAPHPLRLRRPDRTIGRQLTRAGHLLAFQAPWYPERALVADDAALVAALLRKWSAPGSAFPDAVEERRYRDAMRIWPASHCALEYHRWLIRSFLRADGRRFVGRLRNPVSAPVLQVHGDLDRSMLPDSARGSEEYVSGAYEWRGIARAGHFPHEERPDEFTGTVLDWLERLVPTDGPAKRPIPARGAVAGATASPPGRPPERRPRAVRAR